MRNASEALNKNIDEANNIAKDLNDSLDSFIFTCKHPSSNVVSSDISMKDIEKAIDHKYSQEKEKVCASYLQNPSGIAFVLCFFNALKNYEDTRFLSLSATIFVVSCIVIFLNYLRVSSKIQKMDITKKETKKYVVDFIFEEKNRLCTKKQSYTKIKEKVDSLISRV